MCWPSTSRLLPYFYQETWHGKLFVLLYFLKCSAYWELFHIKLNILTGPTFYVLYQFLYKEQLKIVIFRTIAVFWYWRLQNWWTVSVGLQISTFIEVWSPFSEKRHADGQRNRQNLALLVYFKLCISRKTAKKIPSVLISNFRRVLNVVCFLLGDSPASEFYMPTFRNTLSVPSS